MIKRLSVDQLTEKLFKEKKVRCDSGGCKNHEYKPHVICSVTKAHLAAHSEARKRIKEKRPEDVIVLDDLCPDKNTFILIRDYNKESEIRHTFYIYKKKRKYVNGIIEIIEIKIFKDNTFNFRKTNWNLEDIRANGLHSFKNNYCEITDWTTFNKKFNYAKARHARFLRLNFKFVSEYYFGKNRSKK